jgi:hypothetical protein
VKRRNHRGELSVAGKIILKWLLVDKDLNVGILFN